MILRLQYTNSIQYLNQGVEQDFMENHHVNERYIVIEIFIKYWTGLMFQNYAFSQFRALRYQFKAFMAGTFRTFKNSNLGFFRANLWNVRPFQVCMNHVKVTINLLHTSCQRSPIWGEAPSFWTYLPHSQILTKPPSLHKIFIKFVFNRHNWL